MSFSFYGLMIVLLSLFPYLIEKIFIYNKPTTHLQIRNINIISLSGLIFFSIFSIGNYGYHRINDTLYLLSLIFLIIILLIYYINFIIMFIKRKKYISLFLRINNKLFRGLVYLIPAIFMLNIFVILFSITYILGQLYLEVK